MTEQNHYQNADNSWEDYNPILNLLRNQLKIVGQEIIVRDEKWSKQFVSFLVHQQEDVVAASLQLLEREVISKRELNLTKCSNDERAIWSDYYLIGIKKASSSLENELLKLGFLKKEA